MVSKNTVQQKAICLWKQYSQWYTSWECRGSSRIL